jgi:HSP20 family protein
MQEDSKQRRLSVSGAGADLGDGSDPPRGTAMAAEFGTAIGLRLDQREDEWQYVVQAIVPGLRPQDIELSLTPDSLTISVESRRELSSGRHGTIRVERYAGSHLRTIHFRHALDLDAACAVLSAGVLTVTLPKHRDTVPPDAA